MAEHNNGHDHYNHRFGKYINNVVALKMLLDYRPSELCQCLKLYSLRGRLVHELKCVVGLCIEAWKIMEELLNLFTCVYVKTREPLSWKLKAQPKNEEEENRIIGYLKDVS